MEMTEKLDRKEFFMQNKERKWLEIEKVLEDYVQEDDELRDRLLELRLNVTATSGKKISNVVQENDKLKHKLDAAHGEIGRLRKQLLTIGMGSVKTDSNGKLMMRTQKLSVALDLEKEDYGVEGEEYEDEKESYEDKLFEGFHQDNDKKKAVVVTK